MMKKSMAAIIDALSDGKVLKEDVYAHAVRKTKYTQTAVEMAATVLSERKVIKITRTRMMLLPRGLDIYKKIKEEGIWTR
jgi:hypothetical protein